MNPTSVSSSLHRPALPAWRLLLATGAAVLALGTAAQAVDRFVSPTGHPDGTGLSADSTWTLAQANASTLVAPGDTVWLTAGTYTNQQIAPNYNGSESGGPVTFKNAPGAAVTLFGSPSGQPQVNLTGRSWIMIDGLTLDTATNASSVQVLSATHCTVQNCTIARASGVWAGISVGTFPPVAPNSYLTIRNCTFADSNYTGSAGGPAGDQIYHVYSHHTLIDNCTFGKSPHQAINIQRGSSYVIVQNCTARNIWHTNVEAFTGDDENGGPAEGLSYIVYQDNRLYDNAIAHATNPRYGTPGYTDSNGLELEVRNCIARRNVDHRSDPYGTNYLYQSDGLTLTCWGGQSSTANRIYHNVVAGHGRGLYIDGKAGNVVQDNVWKNNIFYQNTQYDVYTGTIGGTVNTVLQSLFAYNNFYSPGISSRYKVPGSIATIESAFPSEWQNNLGLNPQFASVADRDFTLLPGSPMIDAGDFLTTAVNSAASPGTSLVVADAKYFCDGYGLIPGDTIRIGAQTATISSVDYGTNTITLTAATTWSSGAAVSLPYSGSAPDIGAFEYAIAAPTGLTATAVSPTQIDLVWTDNTANETAFRLQRKTGAAGAYADTTPATVAANTVTFSDTGVADNTTYFYQVRAENPLGNSAWSAEAGATTPEADTTAPEITSLTATPDHLWPANHKMVAVTLTAMATDSKDPAPVTKILSVTSSEAANGSGDGNTAVDWEITGDLTLNLRAERSGNGPGRLYTVTVQSTDASGNSSTAAVLIPVGHNNDTQPPTVALTAPANGALVGGNVAVAATASDNDSVVGVQFKLDGANLGVEDSSAPYGLSWNTTAVANGNHTLTAVARDENGNTATSAPVIVFVDNAPPSVAVTTPAADSLLTGNGITLTASATDNVAVAAVQFQLDGTAVGAELTAAPYELTWDSATVADGNHAITAVARDTLGNTATSAAVTVTTDNLAPAVSLTVPAANAIVGRAAVTLTATASDIVGVAGVSFFVDGNPVGAEDTVAPYGIAWDSTAVSNGNHTLTAVARDHVGHSTESAAVAVTVDNTPPTVAVTAPADGATVSGSSVAVAATAADDTGVVGVRFKLDGVNLGAEDTTSPYGINWNSATATLGVHTLTAVARDAAGNLTTSAPVTVTVESAFTPFQMVGNQVVMEAEHSSTRTTGTSSAAYKWIDVTEVGASGAATNNAVQSQPTVPDAAVASPAATAARADYHFNVPAGSSATFYVHLRARGATGNDDSVNVSINGSTTVFQQLNLPRGAAVGAWVRTNGTFTIPAGVHTLTLWMRENGAVVDKIVLKDTTTLPTGTGPAESPQ